MTMEPQTLKTKQEFIDFFRIEGFNVIPCQPRKKEPAVAWKKYQNEKYIENIPDTNNIAVMCGAISGGLVVIDLDAPELIKEMDFEGIKKNTLVVQSGSGGYHIYCKPLNEKIHTMRLQNDKGQHVDIQSDGTYVLAPPSIHPDSGEEYKIISSTLKIDHMTISRFLTKLETLGFKTKGTKPLADIIKGVSEGQRNNACFRYACHLFQQAKFDKETALHEIKRWNNTNSKPLPETELLNTFESAWTYRDNPEFVKKSKSDDEDEKPKHTEYARMIMNRFKFKTVQETEEILFYDNGIYCEGGESLIKVECEKLIENCSKYMVNEVTATIQRSTMVPRSAFNLNLNYIHLKNCIYDLDTGKTLEFSPDILATNRLNVSYEDKAVSPKFMNFLRQCLKPSNVFTVLEQMAACMIRSAKFGKAFMYVGEGSNGKSSLLYILESILGKENISHISIHELDDSRFAKAELVGKLANIYADISNQELRNVGILKIMITGDRITVEKKNKNPFSMENYSKLFFSANQIPQVYDDSDGFYRRFMLVEWNKKFSDREANVNLKYELTTEKEKSGILYLLLHFARNLNRRGYFANADTTLEMRQKWKQRANSVEQFLETQVTYTGHESDLVEKTRLYQIYCNWCKDNKLSSVSRKTFNEEVRFNSGFTDDGKPHRLKDGKQARCWQGGTLDGVQTTI